jgi:serine acetyltransferase
VLAREKLRGLRKGGEKPGPEPEHPVGRRTRHAEALHRASLLRRPADEGYFGARRPSQPPASRWLPRELDPQELDLAEHLLEEEPFFGGPFVLAQPPPSNLAAVPETEAQTEAEPEAAAAAPAAAAAADPASQEDRMGTVRGMSFDEAHTASDELPPPEYGVWELIWSDYLAHYHYKDESERSRRVLFLPRMLTNSNLHCNVLVRLIQGTPLYMAWFWRRLLIAFHACDFQPFCRIGPGLRMPHPIGILVGHAVLGRDVVLQHHITISAVTTNWRSGKSPGFVQIGDGVTVFTGTVIAGRVVIGDQAMLGANSLVVRDIPARNIMIGGRLRPATEQELLGT